MPPASSITACRAPATATSSDRGRPGQWPGAASTGARATSSPCPEGAPPCMVPAIPGPCSTGSPTPPCSTTWVSHPGSPLRAHPLRRDGGPGATGRSGAGPRGVRSQPGQRAARQHRHAADPHRHPYVVGHARCPSHRAGPAAPPPPERGPRSHRRVRTGLLLLDRRPPRWRRQHPRSGADRLGVRRGLRDTPGLWHSHHNESGRPAYLVPIQDAGLHTYLRSLDIRFAPAGD